MKYTQDKLAQTIKRLSSGGQTHAFARMSVLTASSDFTVCVLLSDQVV